MELPNDPPGHASTVQYTLKDGGQREDLLILLLGGTAAAFLLLPCCLPLLPLLRTQSNFPILGIRSRDNFCTGRRVGPQSEMERRLSVSFYFA